MIAYNLTSFIRDNALKPGLHKPQLQFEKSVTLVSYSAVRSKSAASLDYKRIKSGLREPQLAFEVRVNQA